MSSRSESVRWAIEVTALAGLYVVTGRLGLLFAIPPGKATALWIPSGLAFVAAHCLGHRIWPGIWLGAFLANLWDYFHAPGSSLSAHLLVSSAIATGSTAQAVAGNVLLKRISPRFRFDRSQEVFWFAGAVPFVCLLASTVGVASLCLLGFAPWREFPDQWRTWWLGDTASMLVVAPLLLSLDRQSLLGIPASRLREAFLSLGLLLFGGLCLFSPYSPFARVPHPLAFLLVPVIVWVAARAGPASATVGNALLAIVAIAGTLAGYGPFAQEDRNASLLLLLLFLAVMAITALVVSASATEQHRTQRELASLNQTLEQRIADRTGDLTRQTESLAESRESLRKQTQLLELILHSASEGVVVADENGKFLLFNPVAEELIGLGKTDAAPPEWSEHYGLFLPDEVTPFPPDQVPLVRAIRGEQVDGVELFIRHPGRPEGILIEVSGRPLRDAGENRGGIVIFRDITRRKRAEVELARANAELERRVEERTAELEATVKELESFGYSVSHDLRAPLRAIDGFSRILIEEFSTPLPEEAQRFLRRVRENTQQMGKLIDDLLAFSRLGRQPLQMQRVALAELVRQVAEELRIEETGRRIEIQVADLPPCLGDPALLKQVFRNLLGNAVKYTRRRDPARIDVTWYVEESKPEECVVSIRDNGVGFDTRYAQKLFGVFQRLHRAEDYEGTGVGLAIVQRILHRHGGRIWAEAEVDRGATFSLVLRRSTM